MKYKLVCFDVDGTLIDNVEYSWQIFHDFFKTNKDERELARKRYFNGEISYHEWAEHDINMWIKAGAKKKDFYKAMKKSNIRLMKGVLETISALRKKDLKIAIISGSINILLDFLMPNYERLFDDVFLSKIYFDAQGNVERIEATEFDMDGKALALKKIALREGLRLSECVFIGDHKNDVEIAKEAGLAIAFNPKSEELIQVADIVIRKNDLREALRYIV